jgi:ribonuclease HI
VKKIIVYTDGASRGNPGHASAGFVIQTSDGVIWYQGGVYLDKATNNVAEYMAVKLAFEKLIKDFSHWLPAEIELRADSKLVIEQLAGRFKIRNPGLLPIYQQIKTLIPQLGEVSFTHVPREQNFLADGMANQALDTHLAQD